MGNIVLNAIIPGRRRRRMASAEFKDAANDYYDKSGHAEPYMYQYEQTVNADNSRRTGNSAPRNSAVDRPASRESESVPPPVRSDRPVRAGREPNPPNVSPYVYTPPRMYDLKFPEPWSHSPRPTPSYSQAQRVDFKDKGKARYDTPMSSQPHERLKVLPPVYGSPLQSVVPMTAAQLNTSSRLISKQGASSPSPPQASAHLRRCKTVH